LEDEMNKQAERRQRPQQSRTERYTQAVLDDLRADREAARIADQARARAAQQARRDALLGLRLKTVAAA
jgi:hypothetical protein